MPATDVHLVCFVNDAMIFICHKLITKATLSLRRIGAQNHLIYLFCVSLLKALLFHFVMLDQFVRSNVVSGFLLRNISTHLIHWFSESLINLHTVRFFTFDLPQIIAWRCPCQFKTQVLLVLWKAHECIMASFSSTRDVVRFLIVWCA